MITSLGCMAMAIFFEGRNQDIDGQVAIGKVIMERVESKTYPDTVCEVVKQSNGKLHQCQFSFYCDGLHDDPWLFSGRSDRVAWDRSKILALKILNDETDLEFEISPTHYHTTDVVPYWVDSNKMNMIGQIGDHIFYREER